MMSLGKSQRISNSSKQTATGAASTKKSINPGQNKFLPQNGKRIVHSAKSAHILTGVPLVTRRVSCRARKPSSKLLFDPSSEEKDKTEKKSSETKSTLRFFNSISIPSRRTIRKGTENKNSVLNFKSMGADKYASDTNDDKTDAENTQQPFLINGRSLRKRKSSGLSVASCAEHEQGQNSSSQEFHRRPVRNNRLNKVAEKVRGDGQDCRAKTKIPKLDQSEVVEQSIVVKSNDGSQKVDTRSSDLQNCKATCSFRRCYCTTENFGGGALKSSIRDETNTLCGAIESIGSSKTGCFTPSTDLSLHRVSHLSAFRVLCSAHLTRQKSHQCCPLCGNFCSEGDSIITCNGGELGASKGSISHLFHKECALNGVMQPSNNLQCPHCGETTGLSENCLGILSPGSVQPIFLPDRKLRLRTFAYGTLPAFAQPENSEEHFFNAVDSASFLSLKNLRDLEEPITALDETVLSDEAFLHAIENRDLVKVYNHLANSGDPNISFPSRNMKTALHLAVESMDVALTHLVCDARIETNLNVFDADGLTPMMTAAKMNNRTLVYYLISASADHLSQDKNGLTVIHHAIEAKSREVVQAILEYDRSILNISDNMGLTPLMLAAKNKFRGIAHRLSECLNQERRAVLEMDNENNTSLHWCARLGYIQVALRLLDCGAFLDFQNKKGETPLHVALKSKQFTFAICLLKKGADPTLLDSDGHNATDLCSSENSKTTNLEDIKYLKGKYAVLFVLQQMKTNGELQPGKKLFSKSDISKGNETLRISCVNLVNVKELPLDFTYTTSITPIRTYFGTVPFQPAEHNCPCSPIVSPECEYDVQKSRGEECEAELFYDQDGRLFQNTDGDSKICLGGVSECSSECDCDRRQCKNRVVQSGIKALLQVFHTPISQGKTKGWGLKSLTTIPMGSFVCEYTGEFLSLAELEKRSDDSYAIQIFRSDANPTVGFAIDSKFRGNLARFVNHSCSPNAVLVKVTTAHNSDSRVPRIALFARRTILSNEEITLNYGKEFWSVKIARDNMYCLCSSANCEFSDESIERPKSEVQILA